jgi:hypothetical protein
MGKLEQSGYQLKNSGSKEGSKGCVSNVEKNTTLLIDARLLD